MQKFLCSLVMIHPGSGIYALFIFTEPVGHFPESADAVGGLVPNCSHGDVSPEGINKADAIFFLLDYLAIMGLFVCAGHYLALLCKKLGRSKNKVI